MKNFESLKESAQANLKRCFRAINIWLFVWPLWASCLKYGTRVDDTMFDFWHVVVHFLILVVILWAFSKWFKVKKSPASAYTWFGVNLWLALSFLLLCIRKFTVLEAFLTVLLASGFLYYFVLGVRASKSLSMLNISEEKKK